MVGWCSLAFSTDSSRDGGGGGCGDPIGASGWDTSSMGASKAESRFTVKLSKWGKPEGDGEGGTLDNGPLSFEDDVELDISVTRVVVLSY